MKVYQASVEGVFVTNCYFIIDEASRHGFLIDCGAQGKDLAALVKRQGWTIEKILLTHGHFDHTGGIRDFRKQINVPVWSHVLGPKYLLDPVLNLSRSWGADILVQPDHLLEEGDIVSLAANPACQLKVLYTPGHTDDSVTYYDAADATAFVGDTIFKGQPGLDDFPTGNKAKMLTSIRKKIITLPENTTLLSGHSPTTQVGAEKHLYL